MYIVDTYFTWKKVTETEPSQDEFEVIGFSPKWIDEDYNPNGTRACFRNGDLGFTSAVWNNYQDCYRDDNDSIPTHYILIPKTDKLK